MYFKDHRDAIWEKLSQELGGTFVDRSEFLGGKIVVSHGNWFIHIDRLPIPGRYHTTYYTRFITGFANPKGYRLSLYPQGLFENIEKLFGIEDIRIGIPEIDDHFVIQTNDIEKTVLLLRKIYEKDLQSESVEALTWHHKVLLEVREQFEKVNDSIPETHDLIVMTIDDDIVNLDELKTYYDIFAHFVSEIAT